jgi:hypothetical protein
MDYAGVFGTDESSKECQVYRNHEALDKGQLIDREQTDVHSLYQYFK